MSQRITVGCNCSASSCQSGNGDRTVNVIVAAAMALAPRSEDVLAKVRDDIVFTVVCGADDRCAILLMNVAEALLYLTSPLDDQP